MGIRCEGCGITSMTYPLVNYVKCKNGDLMVVFMGFNQQNGDFDGNTLWLCLT